MPLLVLGFPDVFVQVRCHGKYKLRVKGYVGTKLQ